MMGVDPAIFLANIVAQIDFTDNPLICMFNELIFGIGQRGGEEVLREAFKKDPAENEMYSCTIPQFQSSGNYILTMEANHIYLIR